MSYLCDLFCIFIFILKDILLFLLIFQKMHSYLWMITWMKNVNSFQVETFQPQSVA